MTVVIPSEAVEAVARALAGNDNHRLLAIWDANETAAAEGMRDNYRVAARIASQAAYPHVRAQVVAEICEMLRAQGAASPAEYDTLTGAADFIERREAQR